MAYTLPNSVAGLFAGGLTKTMNRKLMLVVCMSLLSLFQFSTGIIDSFLVLALLRFCHGAVSSAINPLAFSLMADYFPPDKRSTANSILSGANFIGIALSSLTIILIKNIGWRASYCTMGALGLVGAIASLLTIKNPTRGRFETAEDKIKRHEKEKAKPKGIGGFFSMINEVN